MAVEFVGSGNDDGVVLGRSSGKLGFYGLTTVVTKPSITAVATATATTTLLELEVTRLTAALVSVGLIDTAG